MLTFDSVWHFGEVFSSRMNPGFHCTVQMADGVYGVMWVSGLLMSTLWIEWPMVAVGLWYGQAYVMDNEHRCILFFCYQQFFFFFFFFTQHNIISKIKQNKTTDTYSTSQGSIKREGEREGQQEHKSYSFI